MANRWQIDGIDGTFTEGHTKMNFSKRFSKVSSDKVALCNNNNQTWFSDKLISAQPLGGR